MTPLSWGPRRLPACACWITHLWAHVVPGQRKLLCSTVSSPALHVNAAAAVNKKQTVGGTSDHKLQEQVREAIYCRDWKFITHASSDVEAVSSPEFY